jgi:hypothetical protein
MDIFARSVIVRVISKYRIMRVERSRARVHQETG